VTGSSETLACGVDVGASTTKVVVLDLEGNNVGQMVCPSGVDYAATARAGLEQTLGGHNPTQIVYTISTGYGRDNVDFSDETVTEIHCHGVGCYHSLPHAMTIIDVGGQDNKVIRIDDQGQQIDFKMNRKCAAGTGAFIEEMALRLGVEVDQMDALAKETSEAVHLSSFCTVFAKTEILAHLRRGVAVPAIVRGAFLSVIQRVIEMDPLDGQVVLTGGVVAHNPTMAEILGGKLNRPVLVPPEPQLTGALGAALLARRKAMETLADGGAS